MKAVDLFAGCGGMSLGFERAGFNIIGAYENWQPAVNSYRLNFGHQVHELDLADYKAAAAHINKFYSPDVIIGGPPCQDFSIANNRKKALRANLTIAFARTVALVRPRIVVMENVYNIERSRYLAKALKIFSEAGYGITQRVIDASRVGVPQMRKRYFMIGILNTPDELLGPILDIGLSENRTTVRDYFGNKLKLQHYYAHPRNYTRRAIFSVDEPAATIRRVNRPVPKTYKTHPADKAPVTRNLRPLTTSERAQLQTFPKTFIFAGTKSQQEQQIGNAVPIRLAEYVAKAIKPIIRSRK